MLAGQLDWRTVGEVPALAGVRQALTGWRQHLRHWLCGMHGHERHIHGADGHLSLRCVYCGLIERGWEVGPPRLARRLEGDPGRHRLAQPTTHAERTVPRAPVRSEPPLRPRVAAPASTTRRTVVALCTSPPVTAAAMPRVTRRPPLPDGLLAAAVVALAVGCVLVGRASVAPARTRSGPASAPHA